MRLHSYCLAIFEAQSPRLVDFRQFDLQATCRVPLFEVLLAYEFDLLCRKDVLQGFSLVSGCLEIFRSGFRGSLSKVARGLRGSAACRVSQGSVGLSGSCLGSQIYP